jgi:hypothetical protein
MEDESVDGIAISRRSAHGDGIGVMVAARRD